MTSVAMKNAPTAWRSAQGIAVQVLGEGEPVLLLHGIGGSAASCAPLASALAAAGLRTYSWDAPGYGESADPEPGRVDYGALVIRLLDELGVSSAHLFGTSWGGVIAMRAALEAPDRIASLVLADSTRGSAVSAERAAGMRARLVELHELGPQAFAAARAGRLVVDPTSAVATTVEADMAQVRVSGYAAAVDCMASTDLGPSLHQIEAPTLVLVGREDAVTGVDESRLLADAIPGARFGLILGAGHAALQEQPAACAAQMLAFYREALG